jgi:predicted lipoprotein with Yx(FWY)xxD motif
MRRNLTVAIAATVVVAAGAGVALATGSNDDGTAASSSVSPSATTGTGATAATAEEMTVSILQVEGFGDVLAGPEGRVLYTSEVEAEQEEVLCTDDSCTSFWEPLEAESDTATGPAGVGELGVVERPDGTEQVTLDGIPLYTFSLDEPAQATGEGLSDEFGGLTFTWHVALAEGGTASTASSTPNTSGGLPGDYDLGY